MKLLRTILVAVLITAFGYSQSLSGVSPANSYKDLLHLNNSNAGITSSLLSLYDGNGGLTALQLSTLGVYSTGTLGADGDLTIGGSASFAGGITGWAEPGCGIIFDGVDDKMTFTSQVITGSRGVFIKFKTGSMTATRYLFNDCSTVGGMGIAYNSSGDVSVVYRNETTAGYVWYGAGAQLQANTEYTILAMTDKTTDKLYINGSDISTSGAYNFTSVEAGVIGQYAGGSWFDGKIYEIKYLNVYDTELNTILYNNGLGNAEIPFKYRWGSQTELGTNGDMELDANWSDYGTVTQSRSSTVAHGGTYSRKAIATAVTSGIQWDYNVPLVAGKKYHLSMWVYGDATNLQARAYASGGNTFYINPSGAASGDAVSASWTNWTLDFTADISGNYKVICVTGSSNSSSTFYTDDVSIVAIGAVASYIGQNATASKWFDESTNNLNGTTSGSPQLLNKTNFFFVPTDSTLVPSGALFIDGLTPKVKS